MKIRNARMMVMTIFVIGFLFVFFVGADDRDSKVEASTINVKYFTCITIDSDDSLTSIAHEYISDEYDSVSDYIKEVKSINNLTSDTIYCGATLVVPYYAAP